MEGIHVKGQMSAMASRRYSPDGRKTLWKEYMSTTSIRVGRSGSNSPIEKMTMSTTRSKSREGIDSLSCKVERMGQVITYLTCGEVDITGMYGPFREGR
jgi:hypothetical protein